MKRRSFLAGILAAASAPAIVRASSLMVLPPQKIIVPNQYTLDFLDFRYEGSVTGRYSSEYPTIQELPRNFPIQGQLAEMMQRLRDERMAQPRALNPDFGGLEERIMSWQS